MVQLFAMNITRSEIQVDLVKQTLYFDFTLDNQEAITAQAIADIAAAEALAIPPPFGEIVSALILSDAADINANNKGNGVGANINAESVLLLGVPPVVTHKNYFPL
jgi:hypothetical protein